MLGFLRGLFGPRDAGVEMKASPTADVEMEAGLGQLIFGAREDTNLALLVQQYGLLQAIIERMASAVATLPWQVERNGEVVAPDDGQSALARLLRQPNADMDWRHFMHVLAQHYLIYGDVFMQVIRRVNRPGSTPIEVWPLDPFLMSIKLNEDGTIKEYVYGDGAGRKRVYQANDPRIGHISAPSVVSNYRGQSLVPQATAIGDILNMYAQKLYESLQGGINSPAVLVFRSKDDGFISPESRERIKAAVREFATGRARAGTVMTVFDVALEKHDLQRKAIEADDMDARNELKREMCFMMGVPPILMGLKNDSTYNNYRTALAAFYTDTILPRVAQPLAQGLSRVMGIEGEQFTINTDAIPALAEQRVEHMDAVSKATFLTINEKRQMMGLGPVEGGDVVLVPGSMAPLDEVAGGSGVISPDKAADVYRLPVGAGK